MKVIKKIVSEYPKPWGSKAWLWIQLPAQQSLAREPSQERSDVVPEMIRLDVFFFRTNRTTMVVQLTCSPGMVQETETEEGRRRASLGLVWLLVSPDLPKQQWINLIRLYSNPPWERKLTAPIFGNNYTWRTALGGIATLQEAGNCQFQS